MFCQFVPSLLIIYFSKIPPREIDNSPYETDHNPQNGTPCSPYRSQSYYADQTSFPRKHQNISMERLQVCSHLAPPTQGSFSWNLADFGDTYKKEGVYLTYE